MYPIKENQRYFENFMEVLNFLALLNPDVDTSKSAPDFAMFSKSKGIVSGLNLIHLCQEIHDVFGIRLVANGCVQYANGYLLTFEDGYLERVKPELRKELSAKSKADLLAMAKEKGLDVSNAMKKDEILQALVSA